MLSYLRKNKRGDIAFFALYPLIAALASIYFQVNLLVCGLLFFALPTTYLLFKIKDKKLKALGFSLIISVFLSIVVDYMGFLDKSWYITSTIFPFRIFEAIPLEDIIWIFFVTFELVLLYEYFFNPKAKVKAKSNRRILIMLFGSMLIFTVFIFLKFFSPSTLFIPYFYFIWGTVTLLLPCLAFLYFHPNLILRFLTISLYTFYVGLLSELVSLHLNYWSFPGNNFIGWVNILGLNFPIEEFMLFLMFIPPAFLTYYEFFDDDRK